MDMTALSSLGSTVLNQGIAFLYTQAGELLNRRRDRRQQRQGGEPSASQHALDGTLDTTRADEKALDRLETVIGEDRRMLYPYWKGKRAIDPHDERMLAAIARLRASLEDVYGQAITFTGETGRRRTGTTVTVRAVLGEIHGSAEIAHIDSVRNADVELDLTTQTIGPGGSVKFGEIGQIGSPDPSDRDLTADAHSRTAGYRRSGSGPVDRSGGRVGDRGLRAPRMREDHRAAGPRRGIGRASGRDLGTCRHPRP